MERFKATNVVLALRELKELQANCLARKATTGGGAAPVEGQLEQIKTLIDTIHQYASESQFVATKATTIFAKNHYLTILDDRVDVSMLAADLRHIEDDLVNDISKQAFLRVSSERRVYLDNEMLLGAEVKQAFPSASVDLREAGNCLASGCDTAAVFHLMRAVEWGLRAFAVHLGFRNLRSKTKSGKVKLTPVSYSDWEHVLLELQNGWTRKSAE